MTGNMTRCWHSSPSRTFYTWGSWRSPAAGGGHWWTRTASWASPPLTLCASSCYLPFSGAPPAHRAAPPPCWRLYMSCCLKDSLISETQPLGCVGKQKQSLLLSDKYLCNINAGCFTDSLRGISSCVSCSTCLPHSALSPPFDCDHHWPWLVTESNIPQSVLPPPLPHPTTTLAMQCLTGETFNHFDIIWFKAA